MKPRQWIFIIVYGLWFWMSTASFGSVFTVSNTEDSGSGSLRQAILAANAHTAPDTITFDIPQTGTFFNGVCWFIQPFSDLPALTDDGTLIDGTTQTTRQGDTNTDGPEIYITGYQGRNGYPVWGGICMLSSHNVVRGLIVSCFIGCGIMITGEQASYNQIEANFLGVNFSGTDTLDSPNGIGIVILNGAKHNRVGGLAVAERNLISGNMGSGIDIQHADSNRVIGNYIGTDKVGIRSLGNGQFGVSLYDAAGNIIGGEAEGEGNLISGNGMYGVYVSESSSFGNLIAGNRIGTNANGTGALPNESGVVVHHGATQNQIGPGNVICYNKMFGILLYLAETIGNTITRNSISMNGNDGITFVQGANRNMPPPDFQCTSTGVEGTAQANAVVEIFSDPAGQGLTYEGSTTADDQGRFSWTGTPGGPLVTATATDTEGNTSEFSTPVEATDVEQKVSEIPEAFALLQNYPNPFNPSTLMRYTLPQNCKVKLEVYNALGQRMAVLVDQEQRAGQHEIVFRGEDLPSGLYFYRLQAGNIVREKKMLIVR